MGLFVTESVVVVGVALLVGAGLGWLTWSARSPLRERKPGAAEHDQLLAQSAHLQSDVASSSAREASLNRDVAAMRDELVERYEELAMRGNERDAARAALRRSQLELAQRTEELGAYHNHVQQLQQSQQPQSQQLQSQGEQHVR